MNDPIPVPVPVQTPIPTPASAPITTTAPVVLAAPTAPIPVAPIPVPPGIALISVDDFYKTKLTTGEVLSAEAHPKADRLLILQIKIGETTKQIVSGIRQFYTPEQMVGKTIIVVNNLQPTKLRGIESFGMLLAVRLPEGGLRLVTTDGPAPSGLEVS
jgi:methionyl-tRNA synthetase